MGVLRKRTSDAAGGVLMNYAYKRFVSYEEFLEFCNLAPAYRWEMDSWQDLARRRDEIDIRAVFVKEELRVDLPDRAAKDIQVLFRVDATEAWKELLDRYAQES
jgi:hypothetical protein